MTQFDAVIVRFLRKTYGFGVVIARHDINLQRGEMAGVADRSGKTIPVERIQGPRRRGDGALSAVGYDPITGAAQLRPLIGGQRQDSALPNRLRVAGVLDLFASPRARDGSPERERLFVVLALPGRSERTS